MKSDPIPDPPHHIVVGQGENARKIAYRALKGENPGLFWLGGYRSDMLGSKAEAINNWAKQHGLANCRYDYSGHGESGGDFMRGNISMWLEDSMGVFDKVTSGPQILIGSSMGCWIALRLAQELAKRGEEDRLLAMILLAPAPDFTCELIWPSLLAEQKNKILNDGFMKEKTDDPDWDIIYTKTLFDDGANNLVLNGLIKTNCPVHILQGGADDVVPPSHALKLSEYLPAQSVTMTIIKDGDHRLSREQDIELLLKLIKAAAFKDQ